MQVSARHPQSYRSESVKALTNDEMNGLLKVVRAQADSGSVVGKRDYALLLLFFLTALWRNEVISLRGRDLGLKGREVRYQVPAQRSEFVGREVNEPAMFRALADYLRAAKREDVLGSERPLRTKHDRAGKSGAPLSSRSFADNLKAYAEDAGIERIHIHQTRHTYARIVAEEAGSFQEPPEALDRENQAATRVYMQRITVEAVKGLRVICRKPTMSGTGLMIRYVRLSSGS